MKDESRPLAPKLMSPQLVPVPHVEELVARGLARPLPGSGEGRNARFFRISPEGQRLIYEAQAKNAEASKAQRAEDSPGL